MKNTRFLVVLVLGGAVASCSSNNNTNDGGPGGGMGGSKGVGGTAGDAGAVDKVDGSADLPSQDVGTTFTVGGTITGLIGSGLILRDNGADDLVIPAGATTFTFPAPVATGGAYAVTIAAQPATPAQACVITAGTGVVAGANVTSVAITCATSTFTIGGTISGLTGTGLVLQNNAGDDLAIPPGATTFTFATPVADGTGYAVTVLTQPGSPAQVCAIDSGTGTVNAVGVTNVAITCVAKTFTVGGTITGLTGTGLVLQNNAGDNLTVAPGATTFTFATAVAVGNPYAVTVLVQPSAPVQTCTVSAGSGTIGAADVTTVTVSCSTKSFTVGGSISGLTGTGMVLRNNGGDNLAVAASANSFTFPTALASGSTFAVTVFTQPSSPAQNCVVSGGTGTIGAAPVTSVVINCAVDKFTIGGQITGLRGPVILQNAGETQTVSADGMFAFPTPISSGSTYAVTVATQPTNPSQTCLVQNGSGTVSGANVTNIMITCSTNSFHVQAVVTGLIGNGLVIRNNTEPLLVHMNGTVAFPTTVPSGSGYSVAVAIQPNSPSQTCAVGINAAGVVGAGDVTVAVACVTNSYNIRVTVSGLSGTGLLLQSGADSVPVAASSTFNMPSKVLSGSNYQVTVAQQPTVPSQTCTVAPAAPAVVGGSDALVSVSCMTNSYRVIGMINGLVGTGLVLEDNLTNDTPISAGVTTFSFSSPVPSNTMYSVTVKTQPSGPNQTCTPSANAGIIGGGDANMVLITCTTNLYTVNAQITGLTGTGLVLQDNAADNLTIPVTANNTTVPFTTRLTSVQTYAVTVLTQPSGPTEICTVTPPMGMIVNSDVTVAVACAIPHSIGGAVTGLVASGLVLRDNGADDLSVPVSPGTFTFATQIASGSTYSVTVAASPPSQSCQVTANASGPVGTTDVTNVAVNCAICASADEGNRAIITCPANQVIASFDFVSFGTPTGACGTYALGACNWPMSADAISSCIGQPSCNVLAARGTFGGDPCPGVDKMVAIQARCQ